jgi:hypothetical protein
MAEGFTAKDLMAEPDGVRREADRAHDLGSAEERVASNLQAEVGDIGPALTDGDTTLYDVYFSELVAAAQDQGEWLKGLGDNLRAAIDIIQRTDEL